MFCLAYRPNRRVNPRVALPIATSLALLLSVAASPQAMAACVISATAGTIVDCTGDSELPQIGPPLIGNVSNINNTVASPGPQIGVRLTTDGTDFTNNASITSQVTDLVGLPNRNAFNVFGVATTDIDNSEWSITNTGSISAVHNGIGQLAAIGILGDAGEVSVENTGTISITRGSITLSTNTAASLTAIAGANAAASLANSAAIWVQEEENESLEVDNDGTISATGKLTSGIFTRGAFLSVENDGIISATGVGSVAIAAHNGTDSGNDPDPVVLPANCTPTTPCTHSYFIGNTVIENTGSILGDTASQGAAAIQIGEPNGLRWAASRVNEGGGPYDPLTITSQAGRRDSTIINSGTITGNIYLGAGNHVFQNSEEGQITGSIDVDQRRSLTYTVGTIPPGYQLQVFRAGEAGGDDDDDEGGGQTFTTLAQFLAAFPDHHFEFDNAAPLIGDVTVHTYNGSAVNNSQSTVLLEPHVTGTGIGSAFNAPSLNSGYISGTLAIGKDGGAGLGGQGITISTIDTTTTLTPIIDSVVHSGEWFLVAQTLFGAALPVVDEDSVLVDWVAAKNGNNSLVIGSTVKNANTINGLSQPGINAINSLLSTDGTNAGVNALAAGVESLSNEGDVRRAGEQLAPETNFATQQAAITLAFLTGQYIDERLLGVGATGPSAAGFGPPSGLGASNIAPPPYALGMSGSSDGRMSLGAADEDTAYWDVPSFNPNLANYGVWGHAFGAGLKQDPIAGVSGYSTRIYGALVGVDNWVSPFFRLGIAGGWGHTGIDGRDDTVANETSVSSYMGLAYGAFKGSGWYLSGRGGFAWHNYDTTRVLNTGGLSDTAGASHNGRQYIGALELGLPMHAGAATFTPVAQINYTHLNQDGYTEASNGGMGLTISDQETNSLQSGLGVKGAVKVAPQALLEGRAIWLHEFDDTQQQVTAAFASVPSFAAAGPGVGRDTANLGVGLLAFTGTGTTFQINYDALLREDFIGHTGSAKLKFDF